jgi:hypothetical protein
VLVVAREHVVGAGGEGSVHVVFSCAREDSEDRRTVATERGADTTEKQLVVRSPRDPNHDRGKARPHPSALGLALACDEHDLPTWAREASS